MKHSSMIKKLLAGFAAAALLSGALTGCGSSSSGDSLGDEVGYASAKVSDYSHMKLRYSAMFSDEMFSKATVVSMLISADTTEEDYADFAKILDLDSITVADESRKVVAAYPNTEEKGMSLKDLEDRKMFSSIVRNVSDKVMADPVWDDSAGSYSVLAGVKRADGTGAVVVGLHTGDYASVCGDDLAEKCGNNTVVLQNDVVLSSTLDGAAKGDTLDKLGVTAEDLEKDSFTLKVGSDEYDCKAAVISEYTVICAEPK